MLARYLAGELDEDVFRVFRLNNGIYGQRQGGHNQMVRVKVPVRRASTPEQLDMLGLHRRRRTRAAGATSPPARTSSSTSSQLEQVARGAARSSASVGLTTREACGDTVRNVHGLPPRRRLPATRCSTSRPWAEAAYRHFLRNPLAQRLPRKFKINFSGCATDCGQAMFNDVGVIATTRTLDDGTVEPGFRVFIAGGLGANPHPALALEEFTAREDLLPTIEAMPARVRPLRQPRQQAAGPHEVARRHDGHRRAAARASSRSASSCSASSTWPGGIPDVVAEARRRARRASQPTIDADRRSARARRSRCRAHDPYERWDEANVVRGVAKGTVSAVRLRRARRHHHRPVPRRSPRSSASSASTCASPTARTSCSAASPRTQLPDAVRPPRRRSAWPSPAPSSPATSSPAPAPTPATSPSPSPAASPTPSATRSRRRASPRSAACASTSPAAPTRCGQHHIADIGFFGVERRAHGQSAPGYQMLLGGYVGQTQIALRREGAAAAGQERARGRRAGRRPLRRRARGRRDVPVVARPRPAAPRPSPTSLQGPRRVPARPTRRPTSTSTTTRPARTWPRSASRSAPPDARLLTPGCHPPRVAPPPLHP